MATDASTSCAEGSVSRRQPSTCACRRDAHWARHCHASGCLDCVRERCLRPWKEAGPRLNPQMQPINTNHQPTCRWYLPQGPGNMCLWSPFAITTGVWPKTVPTCPNAFDLRAENLVSKTSSSTFSISAFQPSSCKRKMAGAATIL